MTFVAIGALSLALRFNCDYLCMLGNFSMFLLSAKPGVSGTLILLTRRYLTDCCRVPAINSWYPYFTYQEVFYTLLQGASHKLLVSLFYLPGGILQTVAGCQPQTPGILILLTRRYFTHCCRVPAINSWNPYFTYQEVSYRLLQGASHKLLVPLFYLPGGILHTVAGCQPYRWLQLGL